MQVPLVGRRLCDQRQPSRRLQEASARGGDRHGAPLRYCPRARDRVIGEKAKASCTYAALPLQRQPHLILGSIVSLLPPPIEFTEVDRM